MVPPAPGRFSTTIGLLTCFDTCSSTMRPTMSLAAPAANGTIAWMFRSGQFCASAVVAVPVRSVTLASRWAALRRWRNVENRMATVSSGVRQVLAGCALPWRIGGAASAVQRRDGRSAGDWIGWSLDSPAAGRLPKVVEPSAVISPFDSTPHTARVDRCGCRADGTGEWSRNRQSGAPVVAQQSRRSSRARWQRRRAGATSSNSSTPA